MSVNSLINELSRQDVRLWTQDGQLQFDGPEGVLTDDVLAQLRQNKSEILEHLAHDGSDKEIALREHRRQELLQMMADDDQDRKYHFLTDLEADPDYVILAVGVRGVATFEMRIPREKYDPILLLEAFRQEH